MLSPQRNLSSTESAGVSLGGIVVSIGLISYPDLLLSLCINSIARRIGSRSNQSLEHGRI
uniref:Uncharacterized protein n=1 Tax=Brassica campestris TaxID=3711 RepID=A0A3P6D164_BRACM|nr:unnamed protein product [Brassica rapa]